MPNLSQNNPVRLEFSGDAVTVQTINAYRPDSTTPLVIGSTQSVAVTDLDVVTSVASRIDVINDVDGDGAVDAGERLIGGDFAANGGISVHFSTPKYCKAGTLPKVKAAVSGTHTVTGSGFLAIA